MLPLAETEETGEGCWKNQDPFLMLWTPFETYLSESTNTSCIAKTLRHELHAANCCWLNPDMKTELSATGPLVPYIAKSHLSQHLNSQICIHDWVKGRDSQLAPWSHVDQCLAQSREGHGDPLQYSCLENPMNRGAWGAAVHEVAKSQMRLKQLSM